MTAFDQHVLLGLNQFARRWPALDQAVNLIAHANLFKGYVMVAVLLWCWGTGNEETRRRNREIILATAIAAIAALLIGKLLQGTLPFRDRPVHDPALGFVPPFGGSELVLQGDSSLPSDHAVFFGAIATGMWFLSRPLGLGAHLYSAMIIYLPRIYVGFHSPTDVLAGVGIGVTVTAVLVSVLRRPLAVAPLRWADRYPRLFTVAAIVVALQFATIFLEAESLYGGARLTFCLARHPGAPDAVWARCTQPRPEAAGTDAAPARDAIERGQRRR